MTPLNQKNILDFAKKEKFPDVQIDESTQQVASHIDVENIQFPLFFRIFEGDTMLQCTVFIPAKMDPSSVTETARVLHLINKEIDLPGFGMDEESQTIFFRHMLPCPDKQFDSKLLGLVLKGMQMICEGFGNTIAAVSSGAVSYAEIAEKARRASKERK